MIQIQKDFQVFRFAPLRTLWSFIFLSISVKYLDALWRIHVPLMMNCGDFGDPLTFPVVPSSGQNVNLSSTLVYDPIPAKHTNPSMNRYVCRCNQQVLCHPDWSSVKNRWRGWPGSCVMVRFMCVMALIEIWKVGGWGGEEVSDFQGSVCDMEQFVHVGEKKTGGTAELHGFNCAFFKLKTEIRACSFEF